MSRQKRVTFKLRFRFRLEPTPSRPTIPTATCSSTWRLQKDPVPNLFDLGYTQSQVPSNPGTQSQIPSTSGTQPHGTPTSGRAESGDPGALNDNNKIPGYWMTGYEESENIVVGVSTDLAEKLELHLQLRVLPQEAARRVRVAHAGAGHPWGDSSSRD